MESDNFDQVLRSLPYNMRNELLGYANSIEIASNEIFKEAGVEYSPKLVEVFIFLTCIRRIWTMINSQFWTIDNTLSITNRYNVKEVKVGGILYSRDSEAYSEMKDLKEKFDNLIDRLGLTDIIQSRTLKEMLHMIVESRIMYEY